MATWVWWNKKKSQINTARSGLYSESLQISKMELFVKIVSGLPLTIVTESSIFSVWQGSEYSSGYIDISNGSVP